MTTQATITHVVLPRRRLRRAKLTLLALLAAAVGASGAAAASPTRETVGTIPYQATVDCSPYGSAFDLLVAGSETLWIETFYDKTGSPRRISVHDAFRETDTNSVTGTSTVFSGNKVETFDLVSGTRTVVGKVFLMTDPGSGLVIQDTGRVVFDRPFNVVFDAGKHDGLYGQLDQLACTALA